MSVENFWRNLKHETLHHFVHPRLDQLVYLIAVEVLPYTEAKMQIFETDFRPGRAKALTPYRKAFKKCWKMLALRPLGNQVYITNLSTWTCSCGQQKYNAFLLCKHMVQAFHSPHPDFFHEVVRRRVTPFYSHHLLHPKDGSELNLVDSGSVSDGDDDTVEEKEPASMAPSLVRGTKRKRAEPEPGMSSPSRALIQSSGSGIGADPFVLSSSPVIADEEEDDSNVEWVKKRIVEVEASLAVLKTQVNHPREAKVLLNSMKAQNIGGDLAAMGSDVRRFTETGTVRTTTHAKKGNKPSARFTRNTMGLYIP
ncbi:hypothetical protein B0H11DRAFT_2242054 [Mycena galericulata]|nr:hypothetical protein B0H11DRAFT_2242054 [Mycena galericulata]